MLAWGGQSHAASQTWTNAGANSTWLTPTNWSDNVLPGVGGNNGGNFDIATFENFGSATVAGITFSNGALNGAFSLGAIEVGEERARNLSVQNSTATPGLLRLNGTIVNGLDNVILRQAATAGTLVINNGGGSGGMTLALGNATNNVILLDGASSQVLISSNIVDSDESPRNLTIAGAGNGTVTLAGANNTYSGLTTVSAGTLRLQNTGNISEAGITIGSGGSFDVSSRSGSTYALKGAVSTAGTGAHLVTTGKAVSLDTGATFRPGGDGAVGTLAVTGDFTLAGNSYFDITGVGTGLADSLMVTSELKFGGILHLNTSYEPVSGDMGQTVQLFSASSYASSFSQIEGTALGHGYYWNTDYLATNGFLTLARLDPNPYLTWQGGSGVWNDTDESWSNGIEAVTWDSSQPGVFDSGSGTVTVSGGVAANGGLEFRTDMVINGDALTLGSTAVTVESGVTVTFQNVITGFNGVTLSGPGEVIFGAANTYTGGTALTNGILLSLIGAGTLGSTDGAVSLNGGSILDLGGKDLLAGSVTITDGSIRNGTLTATGTVTISEGSTLELSDEDSTVGGLDGAGTVNTGSATLTVEGGGTFSGTISGSGGLDKTGSETLNLTGNASGVGKVTVREGTLMVGAIGVISGAPVRIIGNGRFGVAKLTFTDDLADLGPIQIGDNTVALGGSPGTDDNGFTLSYTPGTPQTKSNILHVEDLDGETFGLIMYLPVGEIDSETFLGWWNGSMWVNAVEGNHGAAGLLAGDAPYEMSFNDFVAMNGGWDPTTMLGAWGYDVTGDEMGASVWAVVDHNSEFSVVPEPGTTGLLLFAGLAFLRRRRR